jgi:hypothetical protein
MAGWPTSWVKRAAKADRDMASSRAREATVQGRVGSRWIKARAWPIWGVLEGAEPAGAGSRGGLDPGTDGLDDQDVGQAGDHGLAAGLQGSGLGSHQPEDGLHPAGPGSSEPWI